MNAQEEIQLSDDLRHLVAGQPFTPDVAAIERQGRRQRRRSLAARGLAGLTAAGVAVAGGVTIYDHSSATGTLAGRATPGAANSKPAPTGISMTKAETVAYVQKRIAAVAATINDHLIREREHTGGSPPNVLTIWTDPRTDNTLAVSGRGSSRQRFWEHDYFDAHRVMHWDSTQVSYGPRTWWTQNKHAAGPIQGPVPKGPVGAGVGNSPAQVAQWLHQGQGRILGHPYIDGHRTVELSVWANSARKYVIFADVRTLRGRAHHRLLPGGIECLAH